MDTIERDLAHMHKRLKIQKEEETVDIVRVSQVAPVAKNLPANAGDIRDVGSIPELGRSPGGGHGNPFLYSCLENPMDRETWQATVQRVTKTQTRLK